MNKIFKFSFLTLVLTLSVVFVGQVFAQSESAQDDDSWISPEEYAELHPEEVQYNENTDSWIAPEEYIKQESLDNSTELVDDTQEWKNWGNKFEPAEVDCFDYYTFQSVKLSFGKNHDTFGPGETIHFTGNITNENDHPVVDGIVFARISKMNENFDIEGHYAVDEIVALENVVLRSNETIEASFDWQAPLELTPGDYQIDFFFSVGKKFNLGGLPFSNEVIMGFDRFKIVSDDNEYVSFDRTSTKVNGEKYMHIGGWPRIEAGEKVTITQPVISTFPKDEQIRVSYKLYYWDSLNEEDLIDTKKEMVMVPAKGQKDLSYVIPEMNETVYYLKITAEWREQKSIVNIRVVSPQEHPRLNYPAITKFPLKQGDDFTLFSCFHNSSPKTSLGKVLVTLFDKDENEVGKIEYDGNIAGSMMADKVDLSAIEDYDYLKLEAKVYNSNGELVDQYQTVYDKCDFEDCATNEQQDVNKWLMPIVLFTIVIFGVIVGILVTKKRKVKNEGDENNIV